MGGNHKKFKCVEFLFQMFLVDQYSEWNFNYEFSERTSAIAVMKSLIINSMCRKFGDKTDRNNEHAPISMEPFNHTPFVSLRIEETRLPINTVTVFQPVILIW